MKKNSNIVEYTVTQLNKSIKNVIEYSFLSIRVSGEISQVKKHSSGHIYFTLKDADSVYFKALFRITDELEEKLFRQK